MDHAKMIVAQIICYEFQLLFKFTSFKIIMELLHLVKLTNVSLLYNFVGKVVVEFHEIRGYVSRSVRRGV